MRPLIRNLRRNTDPLFRQAGSTWTAEAEWKARGLLARPSWVPPASLCPQDFEKLAFMGMARLTASWSLGPCCPMRKLASPRRNQVVGLVRREITSCIGSDALLEAADGCVGQWPEDAVYRPFVVVQAMQRFLNLPAISRRHLGFRRQYARRLLGCGCRGRWCG
jgi:hypothetical protein